MGFDVRGSGAPPNTLSHAKANEYFSKAINYVTKSVTAKEVYDALNAHETKFKIYTNLTGGFAYYHAYSGGGYIEWDPLSALQITENGWQSPAVGLAHEMYHLYQEFVLKDIYPNMPRKLVSGAPGSGKQPVSKEEIATVAFESKVCLELARLGHTNETTRTSYFRNIGTRAVKGPTATGA